MALPVAGGASAQELSPFILANPADDFIHGYEWPIGAEVSLAIDDPSNGVGVDFSDTSTAVATWWSGPPTVAIFELKGMFDLQPGQTITLNGAGTTKSYTMTNFMITEVDATMDVIAGMATPSANIQVCSDNMAGTCRTPAADLNGNWSAPADPNTFALQQGADGWAAEYENDKDQTFARWHVPAPQIFANPLDNTVGAP